MSKFTDDNQKAVKNNELGRGFYNFATVQGQEEIMKSNVPFYKKINAPFLRVGDLQTFAGDPEPPAGGGEPNPPAPPTPPEPTPQPQGTAMSLEAVQKFVSEDEKAKGWLQSLTDKRVTDAIQTYESKTLPKKLEDEIAKRFPAESETEKQLRELKQQFEQSEAATKREKLRNAALSTATEKQLPVKLVDFFIGQDEESTKANLETFESVFTAAVQQAVDVKFKDGGRDPQPPAAPGAPLTKESIAAMSNDEINSRWDEIQKFLSQQ
ncbi:hypothetical protein AWH48_12075 [Domibacillus aminovorans]|uniref:Uncharacterized protein n=1 Tax=Domibacillus aminovorans TaxID=29332 RepID=A0A177KI96_9BACI|nr:DUF4355 domain-containing protein [Domibacillus aminovorans]OAH53089.1 hypothetical protein AWH48_12075 [Domibacillus aminovorans]